MKKIIIMSAGLIPTDTTDTTGNYCEWQFGETSVEEYSDEWNGDVRGFVENLIDERLSDDDTSCAISEEPFTIQNQPEGAIVLTLNGTPDSIFFPAEIDEEDDNDEDDA